MLFEQMVKTGFASEIEKLGARAGMKLIRKLVAEGTPEAIAKAERLAQNPAVLKSVAGGHQVKMLGSGSEGAAQLLAGHGGRASGGRGLAVRKVYDPNSPIASPELIKRKVQMSQEVSHPRLAKVYGAGTEGGHNVSFHEFVPGRSPNRAEMRALRPELESMLGQAKQKDWLLGDVRGANIVGGKVVDPIPFRPGEFLGQHKNVIHPTPAGGRVLGMGHQMGGAKPGDLARAVADPSVAAAQAAQRNVRKVRGARSQAGEATGQWHQPKPRGAPSPRKRPPKKGPEVASAAVDPMARKKMPGWVAPAAIGGLGAAGAGAMIYKKRKAQAAQAPKAPQVGRPKVASSRHEWAWNNGLRDELQKIASLAGLVMSQMARREVMPAATSVIDRAEEKAARKVQQLKSVDSPIQAFLPTSSFS